MPDRNEKFELLKWVEDFPKREKVNDFESLLKKVAESYGNTPADLLIVLQHLLDHFKRSMAKYVKQYQKEHDGQLPDVDSLSNLYDRVFKSVLLRMWTYTAEYYQRFTGPEVFRPLDDSAFAALLEEDQK